MSETSKYRHLTTPYCIGNGVDLASGGDPVVPWAIQVELTEDKYAWYNSGNKPTSPIQWRGDALDLPFKSGTLDWVYSSHLLEDFADWMPTLVEWTRVLKQGAALIILIPDKKHSAEALACGQPPNCQHRHEGTVGELTAHAAGLGVEVIEDRLTNCFDGDYSILFVARKK